MKRVLFLLVLLILSFGNAWAERFTVTNDNNEKIIVDVAKPLNQAAKGLVFLQHGLASSMEHPVIQTAKKAYLNNDYTVVSFDSRYSTGLSDGDVKNARLQTFEQDLKTITDWAQNQDFFIKPFAVGGHSLGGASVLSYAAQNPDNISLVTAVAPVVSGNLWEKSCFKNMPQFCQSWQQNGFYEYSYQDKTFLIAYDVINQAKNFNALDIADTLSSPILLVSADADNIIPWQDVESLYNKINTQKQFYVTKQSGHNFTTLQNQQDLYNILYNFIKDNTKSLSNM